MNSTILHEENSKRETQKTYQQCRGAGANSLSEARPAVHLLERSHTSKNKPKNRKKLLRKNYRRIGAQKQSKFRLNLPSQSQKPSVFSLKSFEIAEVGEHFEKLRKKWYPFVQGPNIFANKTISPQNRKIDQTISHTRTKIIHKKNKFPIAQKEISRV